MGLDLTLIPVEHDTPEWGIGHSMLRLDAGRDWYEALKDANDEPVPTEFATFRGGPGEDGEPRYGNTQKTPYGNPLRCVRVSEILSRMSQRPSLSRRDNAALAYVRHLGPDARIALYWH